MIVLTSYDANLSTLGAVVAALLASPFLNFLLQWSRRRVDKDNSIVTGAGDAVEALNESLTGVRRELAEVRKDRENDRAEFKSELESQHRRHEREIASLKRDHERELESLRLEHRAEMQALEKRLKGH